MDASGAGSDGFCYYSLLGIRWNASSTDIRTAYRKQALKWHPDRWAKEPTAMGEAKRRFQRIQEAYSVLSDKGRRAMYDAGLYDPLEEHDQDFTDFMQEMLAMMDSVKTEVSRPGRRNHSSNYSFIIHTSRMCHFYACVRSAVRCSSKPDQPSIQFCPPVMAREQHARIWVPVRATLVRCLRCRKCPLEGRSGRKFKRRG